MDISTIDTSVPRARQLRDEPQSGRYPTRGYQQRQPSLERGVADQTDLQNEEPGKNGHGKELTTTMRRDRSAHLTEDSHISVHSPAATRDMIPKRRDASLSRSSGIGRCVWGQLVAAGVLRAMGPIR